MNNTTYYILTDGSEVFDVREMTYMEYVHANDEAWAATDGNVMWAPDLTAGRPDDNE